MTDRIALTCPSFWGPPTESFFADTDQIYDHPIPLDKEGTLGRFLDSASSIEGEVDVVLVSASSSSKWEDQVDSRIREAINSHGQGLRCFHFTHENARSLKKFLSDQYGNEILEPVSMYGYSDIRNMCLVACHILGYDTVISTDDDVVFHDPSYIPKALKYINKPLRNSDENRKAKVVCGPYCNEEGDIKYTTDPPAWMTFWNNTEAMNEAFEKYVFGQPRLKETSYAVMGNIVLHSDFFTQVPLDPRCPRGEDLDWVINSRIFGFRFYMDRELRVKHAPPTRRYPDWRLNRLDIERFLYDRRKIKSLESKLGISSDYFSPWPGRFLNSELEERVFRTNIMLAMQYLSQGETEKVEGCLNNIFFANHKYDPGKPVKFIKNFKKKWTRLMEIVAENRHELQETLFNAP